MAGLHACGQIGGCRKGCPAKSPLRGNWHPPLRSLFGIMSGMKTILYFQSPSKINAAEKLSGVREIAAKCGWHIQVVEGLPSQKRLVALLDFWRPVGAILECGGTSATVDPAIFGTLPVVFLDHDPSSLSKNAFCVTHDSAATGRMAAQELLRGEVRSFPNAGSGAMNASVGLCPPLR